MMRMTAVQLERVRESVRAMSHEELNAFNSKLIDLHGVYTTVPARCGEVSREHEHWHIVRDIMSEVVQPEIQARKDADPTLYTEIVDNGVEFQRKIDEVFSLAAGSRSIGF